MNNKTYHVEYKMELLELIENGQNVGDVALEYGIPVKTIRRWMDEKRRSRKNPYVGKRYNFEY